MREDCVKVDELLRQLTDYKNDYADVAAEKLLRKCSTSWEAYRYLLDRLVQMVARPEAFEKKRKLFPSGGSVAIMAISRTISYLVVNSIFGLIVLALAKFLGLPVPINWITVLICALAGIPGALLVILLYWLGIVIPIIIAL